MDYKKDTKKEIELLFNPPTEIWTRTDVNILHLDKRQLTRYQEDTIYSKSLLFILVTNGNAEIEINFKKYLVEFNNILLLSEGHFFKALHYSEDFRCTILYIGKEYIEEMYPAEMLYRRTMYNVKMYNIPQMYLTGKELQILQERLILVEGEIKNTNHVHQKELTLLSIRIFFLELSDIIEEKNRPNSSAISRDEVYFQKFLNLLVNHYKKEHLVDFYARSLHITPHYLTVIVKRLTGQTVSDIVFQLIFSDAKLLLLNPDISIQQISEELSFSDQSAFGKFFKRKSGESPSSYKKRIR